MTPEESQELHDAVTALAQQDVHLGRLLERIISYLPGYALPEAAPIVAEEVVPAPAEASTP